VGLGTDTPGEKLEVSGNARVRDALVMQRSSSSSYLSVLNYGDTLGGTKTDNLSFGLVGAGDLLFYTNGTKRATLDSSGNLGLGVTPSASAAPTIEVGNAGNCITSRGAIDFRILSGAFQDGASSWKYAQSGQPVGMLQMVNGSFGFNNAPSGTAGNAVSFTTAMTLDASGRLLIGTTSSTVYYNSTQTYTASAVLKTNVSNEITDLVLINGNNDFGSTLDFARTNTSSNDVRFGLIGGVPTSNTAGSEAGYVYFATKGTADTNVVERARITSNGEFLVGTQNAIVWNTTNEGVVLSGVAIQASRDDDVPMLLNRIGSNGSILVFARQGLQVGDVSVTTTATAYNTSSDYRLKDNPQPLTNSGAFIDALKPKTWDWKADGSKGVGFLAHEVQEVSPGSVNGEKDAVDADGKPVMQAMEYGSAEFIANIVAELQSLRARVAQLESKGA
jgi:hypothetical protein